MVMDALEAGMSALLVILCLAYTVSTITQTPHPLEKLELKEIVEGSLKVLDESGSLDERVQRGEFDGVYSDLRRVLPEDVGICLMIDDSFVCGDGVKGGSPVIVSHRFIAVLNESGGFELHDIAVAAWWR